jgi:hypothetical protein
VQGVTGRKIVKKWREEREATRKPNVHDDQTRGLKFEAKIVWQVGNNIGRRSMTAWKLQKGVEIGFQTCAILKSDIPRRNVPCDYNDGKAKKNKNEN